MEIPEFLNDALGFNLYQAHLLMRRELQKVLTGYNLTPEQWTILAILWFSEKPLKQSEIVQLTLRDKHTTSKIISNLERYGWVDKKNDPEDARTTLIYITKKAEKYKDEITGNVKNNLNGVMKKFGLKERDELVSQLKRLRILLGEND